MHTSRSAVEVPSAADFDQPNEKYRWVVQNEPDLDCHGIIGGGSFGEVYMVRTSTRGKYEVSR